jgi:DNA polymerase-3 subunit epsilon
LPAVFRVGGVPALKWRIHVHTRRQPWRIAGVTGRPFFFTIIPLLPPSPPSASNISFPEPLVFVDLETTGGAIGTDRITEIGIVEVGPAGVTQWNSLVNPRQRIPAFIQQLTGITDNMVRNAPAFDDIAHDLLERLEGRLFIAHNASFDHGFLRSEFKRAGIRFRADVLCTVQLSRAIYPAERRHGLDALIERHALVPSARHRALADADLLWQFWQYLHRAHSFDALHLHIEQVRRRFLLAGDIDEDTIEQIPPGCGVYVFYGEDDMPLYVGKSVRLRQRVRSHLTGARRSAKDLRLAQLVRRVEWTATGGEIGALLAEARSIARLSPAHNRAVRARLDDPCGAHWIHPGAIAIEERDAATGARAWHVIDAWQYFGTSATLDEAAILRASTPASGFELTTYKILSECLSRGLKIVPLGTVQVASAATTAGEA